MKRALSALSESGLEYVIIGGLAATVYGRIRSTADLDVLINIQPTETDSIARLVSAFKRHGLNVLEHEIISSLKERSHFSVFDTNSPLKVDAKGAYTRLNSNTLKNREKTKLLGSEVCDES